MVDNGDVRLEDLIGNDGADTAADLGRLRQQDDVITARRDLLRAPRHWYPIMLDLHKFMVAISRIEVNHDGYGGTAPDAMVWDEVGIIKPRASSLRVIMDYASLPGSLDFWIALGSTWPPPLSLCMMLLCPTGSVSYWSFLPFWPHCFGVRTLLIQVNLVFPTLRCFLCLRFTQAIGCYVKKLFAPPSPPP